MGISISSVASNSSLKSLAGVAAGSYGRMALIPPSPFILNSQSCFWYSPNLWDINPWPNKQLHVNPVHPRPNLHESSQYPQNFFLASKTIWPLQVVKPPRQKLHSLQFFWESTMKEGFHSTILQVHPSYPTKCSVWLVEVFCPFCFSWAEWAVRRLRRQLRMAFCDCHVPKIKVKDKVQR